jgi:MFS family permease
MTPQWPAPAGVPGFRHRQGGLGEPRTAGHALSKPTAFRVTVAMMVLFIYASAAPTPLYGVYQARWGFSAATLTAVFAIYMLFLLATLLVFGSLSDHIGRRPLIMAAIAANMVAFVLFLVANGAGLLFAARALEGVAVGATANALGAVCWTCGPAGASRR